MKLVPSIEMSNWLIDEILCNLLWLFSDLQYNVGGGLPLSDNQDVHVENDFLWT